MELREQFALRPGTSQVMSHFCSKTPSKSYGELPDVHAWNRAVSPTSAPIVKVMNLNFISVLFWGNICQKTFTVTFVALLTLMIDGGFTCMA